MTKEFRQTNRKEKLQEIKREKPDETKEVHIYRWEKGQYLHVHYKLCKHMRIMKQNNRSNMFQFHLFTDLILVYYGLHHLSPWNPDFGHCFFAIGFPRFSFQHQESSASALAPTWPGSSRRIWALLLPSQLEGCCSWTPNAWVMLQS